MISLGRREFRTPFGLKEHPLSPKDEIMINFVSLVGKTDVVPTVLQNTEISRYKYEFFKNGKEPVCNED